MRERDRQTETETETHRIRIDKSIKTQVNTLNTQVNSCCAHTKHTQKQAQLLINVATTKYYT